MQYKNTIIKICEKNGHEKLKAYGMCLCSYSLLANEKEKGAYEIFSFVLFGFLKSKEVLIAVFGEKIITPDGFGGYFHEEEKIGSLPLWQYHHNQMGYTLDEILPYYERYLSEGKE